MDFFSALWQNTENEQKSMTYIKIVYGTGGGNTEIVCEKVKSLFEEAGHKCDLVRSKTAGPEDMLGADLLILASPTYGHGLLEGYMDRLINKAKDLDLAGQKCAVIGLGSGLYDMDYIIESEKILTEFVLNHNGVIISNSLLISKNPLPFLKNIVPEWVNSLIKTI